ncbi:MAG: carbamoyltransferase HypF [Actinomycetia bacterium]|nr:carbamoyltransferase HypF [Actinomycetes bacterium]
MTGVVQGVGFRPFVHHLANELGLSGHVGNDSAGVFIVAAGRRPALDEFAERLANEAPPLAYVDRIERTTVASPPSGVPESAAASSGDFSIVGSAPTAAPGAQVPADTAVCADCLAEMRDPQDRRHGHPFITCTNCGPRFTIVEALPYDRPATTMADFAMCDRCASEYASPADRRHHAQPICCPDCGPRLAFENHTGDGQPGGGQSTRCQSALDSAIGALSGGLIVAVKGLGGYHLAVDATDPAAVDRLRRRKHRPDKPLAVMVADLEAADRLAHLGDAEHRLVTSAARPIVLAPARRSSELADPVQQGSPVVGLMLPYTPVHHLLFDAGLPPLVMTSANVSGEPLAHTDGQLQPLLGTVADAALTHDRPVASPCDDSVVRVVSTAGDGGGSNTLLPVRRARGYVPLPVRLPGSRRSVLATGGELKNAFCLASADGPSGPGQAWIGPHVGDMGSLRTLEAFEAGIGRFAEMYDVDVECVATDRHRGYTINRWAHRTALPVLEVQHHHAHVASVMAEHGLPPDVPVLGFAFDGTGYGTDGTIWGGEVLLADAHGFERLAHLAEVPMPGGDAAITSPWRAALAHLQAAGIEWSEALAPVEAAGEQLALLADQVESGLGCVGTTSMGRLFDAVASLLGLRHEITYEAQAAIELESAALSNTDAPASYAFSVSGSTIEAAPVVEGVVADVLDGRPVPGIAAGFHEAVAQLVVDLADGDDDRNRPVALTGGVFQNASLVAGARSKLVRSGHKVLTNSIVPPNDGGLALGQAYIACHGNVASATEATCGDTVVTSAGAAGT